MIPKDRKRLAEVDSVDTLPRPMQARDRGPGGGSEDKP